MKKKFACTLIIVALSTLYVKAQDNQPKNSHNSGLALELGASVNYYYGLPNRNFGQFENDRVNWQLNGMLGITVARDKGGRRTMIAGFGGFGFNNDITITRMLKDEQYLTTALSQASSNNFYQLEGGLVIADILRISTGVGQQNFNSQALASSNNGVTLNATYLKFNSTTVGIKLNFGAIAWTLNTNFAYGQDFSRTVITPYTGLMLRF